MRSPLRSLIPIIPFVVAATLFLASAVEASALASPVAFPMPFINADYSGRLAPVPHATRHNVVKRSRLHGPNDHSKATRSSHNPSGAVNASTVDRMSSAPPPRAFRRAPAQTDAVLGRMSTHSNNMMANSQDLQEMASQSASQNGNDPAFQQNAATKFSSFQSNSAAFGNLFSQLAADKGLAYYDKTDQLETMLKDYVNMNKNTLSAISTMVYNIPTLGPVLGPIVYDVKCIIDDVLNITENLTDAVWNALQPLLQPLLGDLLGQVVAITCSQLELLGLCV